MVPLEIKTSGSVKMFPNKYSELESSLYYYKVYSKMLSLYTSKVLVNIFGGNILTLFRMGLFAATHGWGAQNGPLPKICHLQL